MQPRLLAAVTRRLLPARAFAGPRRLASTAAALPRFKGVWPIMATPFHPDESLDLDGFYKSVSFMAEAGADGCTIVGVLGESNRMTDAERAALIDETNAFVFQALMFFEMGAALFFLGGQHLAVLRHRAFEGRPLSRSSRRIRSQRVQASRQVFHVPKEQRMALLP